MLLSFPGASYIAGMDQLSKQHIGTITTVIAALAFNMIMFYCWNFRCSRTRYGRNQPRPARNGLATG
jgi:hypothetical protein